MLGCSRGVEPARLAQTVREKVAVEVITIRLTARDASGKRGGGPDALRSDPDRRRQARRDRDAFGTGYRGSPALSVTTGRSIRRPMPCRLPSPLRSGPVQTLDLHRSATNAFDRKDVCDELERFIRASGSGHQQFLVARFDGAAMMDRRLPGCATSIRSRSRFTSSVMPRRSTGSRLRNRSSPARGHGAEDSLQGAISFTVMRSSEALLEALATFPDGTAERRLLIVSGGASLVRSQDISRRAVATRGTRAAAAPTWHASDRTLCAIHLRPLEPRRQRRPGTLWA